MPVNQNVTPVVVTFREIEKALTGQEAMGNIREVASRDTEASPAERAAVMAAIGNVLNELRRAEQKAGARVLSTPHHPAASRLQSLIASGDAADAQVRAAADRRTRSEVRHRRLVRLGHGGMAEAEASVPHPMLRPKTGVPSRSRPPDGLH